MVQGVNLIDFKIPKKEPTPAPAKPKEQSKWSKWEIPKRFEELTEPPKPEGGKMLSLTQRLGFLILLIFILIVFFQLVGYYIESKR